MSKINPRSLMSKILNGTMDAVNRPFTENRVVRAFESALDNFDEQIENLKDQLMAAREAVGEAAKNKQSLAEGITKIVQLRAQLAEMQTLRTTLLEETREILETPFAEEFKGAPLEPKA